MIEWLFFIGYLVMMFFSQRRIARWIFRHGENEWPCLYATPEKREKEWREDSAFALFMALLWPMGLPMAYIFTGHISHLAPIKRLRGPVPPKRQD